MSSLGVISYEIEVETGQLLSSEKAAEKSLDNLQKSMGDTDKASQQLGGGLNQLAKSIAGVLSVAAVVNEFKKAIAVTMEFNATISNLSALTGAVGKDLAVFRQAAIDIGGSTSLSASQAAEAMKLIGSASPELLKSADSLKMVTQQAVTLAEAAGSTLPQAAQAVTGALNMFQLGADQAARVINVLAAGAKEGASEINDTVEAMRNAGVVAAQAGLNFEQFNGAVQALAQGQIKGAEAGTGLRNILTILNTQAKSEFRPSVVGLTTALANLEKAGLDDTQMVKLFGRENITVAKVLLQFRGTMDTVTKAITGTSEAYKQAATNQDNLKGDVANLSSAFETLQIAIGDLSDSTLRDLTKQLTGVLNSFSDNKDGIKEVFDLAGTAALSFAAIITGRVVTGLVGYASAQASALASTIANINASKEAAAKNLDLAKTEYDLAQAGLTKAKNMQAANLGLRSSADSANTLAIANARAEAATVGLNAATHASANTAKIATAAWAGLRTVTSFLGGPAGVFLLAATAVYSFAQSTKDAKSDVDALTGSLDKLTFAQLDRSALASKDKLAELSLTLRDAQKDYADVLTGGALGNQEKYNEKLVNSRARLDDINGKMAEQKTRLEDIAKAQAAITAPKAQAPDKDPFVKKTVSETSEEGQKGLDTLKEQLALAKLTGEAKAKLQAIQKLGNTATEKEKAEAAALGAEIYKLETATKALADTNKKQKTEAEQLAKRAAAEEKKGIESNLEAFTKLGVELSNVGKTARVLAQDQAQLSLNKYATPEQVQTIRDIAGSLYDLKTAQDTLARVDPKAAAAQGLEQQLKDLKTSNEQKLLSDIDYLALKEQAEKDYHARMTQLEIERFAAQSAGNAAMVAGFEALSTSGTQALSGLLSGTMSLKDAMGNIANTVLNAVIGSFVQAGVEWVKQQVMMQAATQATKAAEVGGIAAVTAAQTAATGTIAATTTTAAATTGTAVATSMAPAAGLSSIASFGGAAVIGGAALLATMALAKTFGGKALGGPVQADGMYRVNETGAPEIFNAANGRQYMMPNSRGEVVSNKDATSGGSGGTSAVVNIHNYTGAQVSQTQKTMDRQQIIDIVIGDIMGDGKIGRAVNQTTGTRRQGT